MKQVFYRHHLNANYRYIEVNCDGTKLSELKVERCLYRSDADIYNYNKYKQLYFQRVNIYKIACFYPKEFEKEAIHFCKIKLKNSIENEIKRLQKKLDIVNNCSDQVTEQTSMQEIYSILHLNGRACLYDAILGCED